MYAEDDEWCWRITRTDWKLVFVPDGVVLHHGGHSSMKRWSSDAEAASKTGGGFYFEHRALPRWRLAANQLANYLVVSADREPAGARHTHP